MNKMQIFYYKVCLYLQKDWLTPTFGVVAMLAWVTNAVYSTKFDITQLQGIYATLKAAVLVEHGINSKYNSTQGEMPKKESC